MRTAIVFCGMLFLILDSKSAILGAQQGLELCIRTAIPSLFPFFLLSILLTNGLSGKKFKCLKPLNKLLHIPEGSESLLLIGFLGGYPVGAQAVAQAWSTGQLDKENARRMLGFCSNAGPSFLFGILGSMFSSSMVPWVLWLIHILSAIIAAMIIPAEKERIIDMKSTDTLTVTQALERSVRIMANVCGWIILFRVLISFASRWVLWIIPKTLQTLLIGFLELTNGCCMLGTVKNEGLRFVLASCFLAFGGVCVSMQTASVVGKLGTGKYFPGKIIQLVASFLLSYGFQSFYYPSVQQETIRPMIMGGILLIGLIFGIFLRKNKNNSSNPLVSGV